MGSEAAKRKLANAPECPEEMEYLVSWAFDLHGRSGVGMSGAAPLSYTTVESWARLLDIRIEPYEVKALIALENAIRNPGDDEEEVDTVVVAEDKIETRARGVWPQRKPAPAG